MSYLGELLGLKVPHVLENTLGSDDIESHCAELNRTLEEVGFNQVRRGMMNGNINTIVLDIRFKQAHQGGWTAAYVKESTPFALRESVYNAR
jgi:hypothetical protein